MRKLWMILLAGILALNLCGCGGDAQQDEEQVITRSTETATVPATEAATETAMAAAEKEVEQTSFAVFRYEGQELKVGEKLDAVKLPVAKTIYEVPSCAIEGTDTVYGYEDLEITAYDDGTGELIYSVYFLTPTVTTPEGLGLGDDLAKVFELYGENYEQDGTAYNYYCGDAMLIVLIQNETVISVEYRMLTE